MFIFVLAAPSFEHDLSQITVDGRLLLVDSVAPIDCHKPVAINDFSYLAFINRF
jgi:hypothetical protein